MMEGASTCHASNGVTTSVHTSLCNFSKVLIATYLPSIKRLSSHLGIFSS